MAKVETCTILSRRLPGGFFAILPVLLKVGDYACLNLGCASFAELARGAFKVGTYDCAVIPNLFTRDNRLCLSCRSVGTENPLFGSRYFYLAHHNTPSTATASIPPFAGSDGKARRQNSYFSPYKRNMFAYR